MSFTHAHVAPNPYDVLSWPSLCEQWKKQWTSSVKIQKVNKNIIKQLIQLHLHIQIWHMSIGYETCKNQLRSASLTVNLARCIFMHILNYMQKRINVWEQQWSKSWQEMDINPLSKCILQNIWWTIHPCICFVFYFFDLWFFNQNISIFWWKYNIFS